MTSIYKEDSELPDGKTVSSETRSLPKKLYGYTEGEREERPRQELLELDKEKPPGERPPKTNNF